MKYIKPRHDIALIINPIHFIIGFILFFSFSFAILDFFHAFWICIFCSLIFIFSALGNRVLAENKQNAEKKMRWPTWLLCIIAVEIGLYCIYAGISLLCGKLFLINTISHNHLFADSIKTQLLQYGLFPWSLYGLFAVGMGITAYHKKSDAFMSDIIKPITKSSSRQWIGLVANIAARRGTLFGLSVTFVMMLFLLLSIFISLPAHIPHDFYPTALLTSLVLITLSLSNKLKHTVDRVFSRFIPMQFSIPLVTALLALLILIIGIFISGLGFMFGKPTEPPVISKWIAFDWKTSWMIFSVLWWAFLTPMIANLFVRISHGYSVRSLLIATLIFPLCITLYLHLDTSSHQIQFSSETISILSVMAFFILFPILMQHDYVGSVANAYFPKLGVKKHRDSLPFFRLAMQFTLIATYLFMVIGINAISLLLFVSVFVLLFILLLAAIAIVKSAI